MLSVDRPCATWEGAQTKARRRGRSLSRASGKSVDGSSGRDGSLISFRPMVLDADDSTLIPRPAGPSVGTRRLRAFVAASATLRAYTADWRYFGQWRHGHGRQPFDGAELLERIVGDYMAAIHKALAIATLQRRVGQVRLDANDPRQRPPGP